MNILKHIMVIGLTVGCWLLVGCTSIAEMSGYDSQTLNATAAKQYAQVISQAQAQQAVDTSSNTAKQVHRVFNRLLPYARQAETNVLPMQWQITVIQSKQMNAWAMPGGKMAVYTGLVERLALTDDELAAVIAHEMIHALHEHSKAQAGQKILTNIGLQYGQAMLAQETTLSADTINVGASLLDEFGISRPFSRQHEEDADVSGLFLMAQAGYNPQSAISVWRKMSSANSGGAPLEFLSTHPSHHSRIDALKAVMPQAMAVYQSASRN